MPEERNAARKRDVDGAGRRLIAGALLVGLPARLDRLLQLVRVKADALLRVGGGAAKQLHPRGDDAVLASEVAVAEGLRVAAALRRGKLALERGDVCGDGVFAGREVGHVEIKN